MAVEEEAEEEAEEEGNGLYVRNNSCYTKL